jgi:CheY-like chemotaxis protein
MQSRKVLSGGAAFKLLVRSSTLRFSDERQRVLIGDAEEQVALSSAAPSHSDRHSDPSLLVVEDEPILLAEVIDYLTRRGEKVIGASSYTEAMRILADGAHKIGALITDARMPDGSGIDLIRSVLASRKDRSCRCILMTGHVREGGEDVDDLRNAGVRIVLKPFPPSLLHRELHQAAGKG